MCKLKWIWATLILLIVSTTAFSQTPIQKAVAEIEKENYKEARAILNTMLLTEPTNPEAFYYLGMTYIGDEDYAKAKEQFSKGIKAKTKYPFNHVGLAEVLMHEKNDAQAEIELEKAKEHNLKTNDVNVWIAMGYAYLQNGRKYGTQAEKAFTYAKSIAPTNPKPVIALGDMYMRSGILPSAMSNYEEATKINGKYAEGYYKQGLMRMTEAGTQYQKGKTEEGISTYMKAIDLLKKATEADANYAPAYRELGDVYYRAGKYDDGKVVYKKYLALANNDLKARTRYVNILYLSGNCAEAMPEIEACLKDTTTNVLLRLGAYCSIDAGNYAKGKEYMDKYFERVKPENRIAEDFEALGKMAIKQNDLPKAMENYGLAVDKDSSRYRLFTVFVDSAVNRKNRAVAAKNDDDKKKYALEEAAARQAIITRKAKVEKDPDAMDYYRMGIAYYTGGDLDNCEKTMKEIAKFSPDYIPPYYWLGIVGEKREAAGTKDVAKPYYEKIISLIEPQAAEKRSKYDSDCLVSAYAYMAYNVGAMENGFNCEAAKPFIDKGLAITPTDKNLQNLKTSCP